MSAVQALLAIVVFNDEVISMLRETPELSSMPDWLEYWLRHLLHLAGLVMLLAAMSIASGWGMLQRRRWALWFSVAMFWLGALGNLVGIWMHALFLNNFSAYWQGLPEWTVRMVETNYWSAQISGAVFGAVFAIGFGWTAWKLATPTSQAEFNRP